MRPAELFDLSGHIAIVTGGGSGIGRQMATGLAEAGADVVLCARKAERCEQAAAELERALGVRALGLRCDVRDPAEINAVVDRTRRASAASTSSSTTPAPPGARRPRTTRSRAGRR